VRKTWVTRPAAVAGAVLALSLAGGAAATGASAAPVQHPAPHNVCRDWIEDLHTYPLEPRYRVAAECSYINPSEKARCVLDLIGQPDAHTEWFTSTGVVYHSSWRTPLVGVREARMEHAPR
jgi:hypothetical protein